VDEVLELIATIEGWDLSRFHLLVTSRQLPNIEETLTDLVTSKVCLQDSSMNENITIYITEKLEHDKVLAKW